MQNTLFIFGLGFSARAIARAALAAGWSVRGTSRSGDSPADLPMVPCVAFDRQHKLPDDALHGVTHILSSVPPDPDGDPVLDQLDQRLRACAPQWVGYLSTTGVYGDHQGAWVDEQTPVDPSLPRSRRRVLAEQAWQNSGLPVHVFRLAGIYGPGRSAVDSVRQGTARAVDKPGQMFSRIHIDDIAQTVLASIARPNPGAVYNLCDDDPAPPHLVIAEACRLLGLPVPPPLSWQQAQQELSPMALSFYADNKRVRNHRIKSELGVCLRYPSYREGLQSTL